MYQIQNWILPSTFAILFNVSRSTYMFVILSCVVTSFKNFLSIYRKQINIIKSLTKVSEKSSYVTMHTMFRIHSLPRMLSKKIHLNIGCLDGSVFILRKILYNNGVAAAVTHFLNSQSTDIRLMVSTIDARYFHFLWLFFMVWEFTFFN